MAYTAGVSTYRQTARETRTGCPRCRAEAARLWSDVVAGHPFLHCPHCEGNWVPRDTFEVIRNDMEIWPAVLEREPEDVAFEHTVVYLRCPVCDAAMRRRNFGRSSGVIVDDCRAHGIWFDRGELGRVVRALGEAPGDPPAEKPKPKLSAALGPPESAWRVLGNEVSPRSRSALGALLEFIFRW